MDKQYYSKKPDVSKTSQKGKEDELEMNSYSFLSSFELQPEDVIPENDAGEESTIHDVELLDNARSMTADDVVDGINSAQSYLSVSLTIGDDDDEDSFIAEESTVRVYRRLSDFLSVEITGKYIWDIAKKLDIWASLVEDFMHENSEDPEPGLYFSVFPFAIGGTVGMGCANPVFWAMTSKMNSTEIDTLSILFPGSNVAVYSVDLSDVHMNIDEAIENARKAADEFTERNVRPSVPSDASDEEKSEPDEEVYDSNGGFSISADKTKNVKIYGNAVKKNKDDGDDTDIEENKYAWLR